MKKKARYMTLLELLIGMALMAVLLTSLTYFYQQIDSLNKESERTQKESFHLQYVESRLAQVLPKTIRETPKAKSFVFQSSGDLNGLLADHQPSLLFQYATGTDLNSGLAVTALGRLFLDKQHRLCLVSWTDPAFQKWDDKNPEARLEVLMENVKSVNFKFYVAPERDRSLATKKSAKKDDTTQVDQPKPAPEKPKAPKNNKTSPPPTAAEKKEEPKEENAAEEPSTELEPEPKGQWITEWKSEFKHLPAMIKIEVVQRINDKEVPISFAFPYLNSNQVIVYE